MIAAESAWRLTPMMSYSVCDTRDGPCGVVTGGCRVGWFDTWDVRTAAYPLAVGAETDSPTTLLAASATALLRSCSTRSLMYIARELFSSPPDSANDFIHSPSSRAAESNSAAAVLYRARSISSFGRAMISQFRNVAGCLNPIKSLLLIAHLVYMQ